MTAHHRLMPLTKDKQIRASWSLRPAGKVVVFVHGYNGSTLGTWSEFESFLPLEPKAADYDLIFYGYDGVYSDLYGSAVSLHTFLAELLAAPTPGHVALINKGLGPKDARPDFAYTKVRIVAHSIGAIISRWALVMAFNNRCAWIPNDLGLILFAPAHRGARVDGLIRLAAGPFSFLRVFAATAFFNSPFIQELNPKASAVLRTFRKELRQARASGNPALLTARQVVIAHHEKVVFNGPFMDDPLPIVLPNTDHVSVCKPKQRFRAPLDIVKACL